MNPEYDKDQVLKELGLDQMPEARLKGSDAPNLNPRSRMTFKMAVQLIDPIESAAFMNYIPDWVSIHQDLDPTSFEPTTSRIMSLFTDEKIPMHPKIARVLGMTEEPHAQNHYITLAQDVTRHITELGADGISPVRIFRTSGGGGRRPLLGAIWKMHYSIPDGLMRDQIGANLGLLTDKPTVHINEDSVAQ